MLKCIVCCGVFARVWLELHKRLRSCLQKTNHNWNLQTDASAFKNSQDGLVDSGGRVGSRRGIFKDKIVALVGKKIRKDF